MSDYTMDILERPFEITIDNQTQSITLCARQHFRVYSPDNKRRFGEHLTNRQIDLLRIAAAVHLADSWVCRHRSINGHRTPMVKIEVLDLPFWARPEPTNLLKDCVDFLSGGDDWNFVFQSPPPFQRDIQNHFLRGQDIPIVALYSGGLDSAAGLAARLADLPERSFIPVTVRYQKQKAKLIQTHYDELAKSGLVGAKRLLPLQIGMFAKNSRIKKDCNTRLREITHRCRSLLFMSVAGLVANVEAANEVEVYESGVGSINLPLRSGPANYCTTRSTHPHFLDLVSKLISCVSDSEVRFVLPFAHLTKAEMVGRLKQLNLESLARSSVSCVMHPIRRGRGRQCGHCPACVYRRQAMLASKVIEDSNAYDVDIFVNPCLESNISEKHFRWIKAFHQQIGHIAELDDGIVPDSLRRYLLATKAVSTDEGVIVCAKLHYRYRREWLSIIADAQRQRLPWAISSRPRATAGSPSR